MTSLALCGVMLVSCGGLWALTGISGGSSVTLSTYSGGSGSNPGGGPGGGPGGH